MLDGFGVGCNVIAKTFKLAKIGTSFGKLGKLVRYRKISIAWDKVTSHALERMAERGVTKTMIESIVKNGKVLQQSFNKFMYISKQGVVVMTRAGEIVTTYGSNYFDQNIKNIMKCLF